MNKEQFERLNVLSKRSINDTVTPNELEELMRLLVLWNESIEFNLLQYIFIFDSKNLPY